MSRDFDENGAVFLEHGETSQSLSLSDLFTVKDGAVSPVLRVANPPVRANALYLSPQYSVSIALKLRQMLLVAKGLCPLSISLDIVVLTSTGVLLGRWQVNSGTDHVIVRERLRAALPRAPEKQLYDAAILHTSFARLLGHPTKLPTENEVNELQFFHKLVTKLNSQLHGRQASVSELWYVEEYDVLTLALNGGMKARKFQLGCSKA